MTHNMIIAIQAIQKFCFYNYNFEYNFVEKIWGTGAEGQHFKSKFNAAYDRYGAMGALLAFYAELDNSNKVKLLTYILDNYNDEQKLRLDEERA